MSFEEGSCGFMKCLTINFTCVVNVYDDVLHLQAEIKES